MSLPLSSVLFGLAAFMIYLVTSAAPVPSILLSSGGLLGAQNGAHDLLESAKSSQRQPK